MKEIAMLADMIREELNDAEKYAKLSARYKDDDRQLYDMFSGLSNAELDHANQEHSQAVRLIREFSGEVPKGMKEVWDWEHEKYIDNVARIKNLIATK